MLISFSTNLIYIRLVMIVLCQSMDIYIAEICTIWDFFPWNNESYQLKYPQRIFKHSHSE